MSKGLPEVVAAETVGAEEVDHRRRTKGCRSRMNWLVNGGRTETASLGIEVAQGNANVEEEVLNAVVGAEKNAMCCYVRRSG